MPPPSSAGLVDRLILFVARYSPRPRDASVAAEPLDTLGLHAAVDVDVCLDWLARLTSYDLPRIASTSSSPDRPRARK